MTPEQAAKVATAPLVEAIVRARAGRRAVLEEWNQNMVRHLAPEAVHSADCAAFPGGGRIDFVGAS